MLTSIYGQMEFFVKERARNIVEKQFSDLNHHQKSLKMIDVEESLAVDFVRAFAGYCNENDKVTILSNGKNEKGFNIISIVERNGEQYSMEMQLILAGGHNVQCLHFRYIVKTSLPKIENIVVVREKIVSKIQKLIAEFKQYSDYATRYEVEIIEFDVANDTNGVTRTKSYLKDVQKRIEKIRSRIQELK